MKFMMDDLKIQKESRGKEILNKAYYLETFLYDYMKGD